MRLTVSEWQLLGLHSYWPECLLWTLAIDTMDQVRPGPITLVTTQSTFRGRGWTLYWHYIGWLCVEYLMIEIPEYVIWWLWRHNSAVDIMRWSHIEINRFLTNYGTFWFWNNVWSLPFLYLCVTTHLQPPDGSCDQCEGRCSLDTRTTQSPSPRRSDRKIFGKIIKKYLIPLPWCWGTIAAGRATLSRRFSCRCWRQIGPPPADQGPTCSVASPMKSRMFSFQIIFSLFYWIFTVFLFAFSIVQCR